MNLLYYGDNLKVLREHVKDETADLIYLDPPFKSDQDYNVLFAEHGTKSPRWRDERQGNNVGVQADRWRCSCSAGARRVGMHSVHHCRGLWEHAEG